MKRIPRIFIFSFLISINLSTAQNRTVDSLFKLIAEGKKDTTTVKLYAQIANILQIDSAVLAYEVAMKGKKLAAEIKFLKGEVTCEYYAGNTSLVLSKYEQAIKHYQFVIDNGRKAGKEKLQTSAISNIGNTYVRMGEFKKAMEYLLLGLKMKEEIGDKSGMIIARMNIGNLYGKMGENQKALEEYRKGRTLLSDIKDIRGETNMYINFGNAFAALKNRDSSEYYYQKALDLAKKENDRMTLSALYPNLAWQAFDWKQYDKAEMYYKESMELVKSLGQKESLLSTYVGLGEVYFATGKYSEAIAFGNKGLSMAEELHAKVYEKDACDLLYKVFKTTGRNKEALEYFERYTLLKDSIIGEENQKEIAKKEMQFEFDKKEALMSAEREKDVALANEEKRKQQLILWSVCGILLVVLVFSILIYKSYREKQKINIQLADKNKLIEQQKSLVEEKQKEILDSIQYAEQIQKTLIANHDFVNETIPDSFVFFKPKDIVSGDFYWATKRDGKFFLAVCDSTGHGVPGAFMSLLNISFLNEAINEKFISDPGAVFEHVRKRLIESISQNGRKDGMDGVLVCFDENLKTISYCAANTAPVLIAEKTLQILPNDKMPVGKGEKTNTFTTYPIAASKGDMIYLFTDGYPDQFGGDKGKKFKYKQLQEMFLSICGEPVHSQRENIESAFENWKGNLEQIDDVCVIGIRVH